MSETTGPLTDAELDEAKKHVTNHDSDWECCYLIEEMPRIINDLANLRAERQSLKAAQHETLVERQHYAQLVVAIETRDAQLTAALQEASKAQAELEAARQEIAGLVVERDNWKAAALLADSAADESEEQRQALESQLSTVSAELAQERESHEAIARWQRTRLAQEKERGDRLDSDWHARWEILGRSLKEAMAYHALVLVHFPEPAALSSSSVVRSGQQAESGNGPSAPSQEK